MALEGKELPFGIELQELGPFVNNQLTVIIVIMIFIWATLILVHMKGYAFPAALSGMSIVIVYSVLYFCHILKTLEDANLYTLCNEPVYLL